MKRTTKQDETKITIDSFGGLDLQPEVLSRPANSWKIAQNVDLFIPGAMRKVVGPARLYGPFGAPLKDMFNYLRSSADALQQIGVGTDGHLYDILAGTDLATLGSLPTPPWVGQFPGLVNGTEVMYLVAPLEGGQPVKYEVSTGVTQIGVSVPAAGVTITPSFSSVNANAYLMQAGIQYLWTYFNPVTLHESSPSPVTNAAISTPTVNAPPAATPYTMQIILSIPTAAPTIGSGYTRIRVYRTRDGGATFYLVPALYNSGGVNQLDINYSAAITGNPVTLYDGVAGSSIAPAPDQLLVNPPGGAPAIGANDPPPQAIWGANYQNRLWLIDTSGRRLVFSNLGDFQSFGLYNFMDFSKDTFDTIEALVPLSDRMIVLGRNSTRQITGTDFSDFVEVPVDMRRGVVGRRAAVNDGDIVYVLTPQSLARLSFATSGPPFVGDRIKPITDTIQPSAYHGMIQMELDTIRGQMLFSVQLNAGSTYNDTIILTDLSRESPFTTISGLPAQILCCKELEHPTTFTKDMFVALADKYVYQLYGGNGTLTATLQTQALPLDEYTVWRVFKRLHLFGTDLTNWFFSWSIGQPDLATGEMVFTNFSTPLAVGLPLGSRDVPIGGGGRQIVLQFTHSVDNGIPAVISKFEVPFEDKLSGG